MNKVTSIKLGHDQLVKSRLLAFWIGFFLFSIYLLSFSGKLHVMDEFAVFAVGNNLVQHGRADINQFIWTNHWTDPPPGIWGEDGNLYTKKAPGISLAAAPLIWLGHTIPGLNAVHVGLLTNAIVTALTGSLLFIWLVDLGFSPFVSSLTVLGYGLGTIAWVYARFFWEHTIMALVFLVMVWALFRAIYSTRVHYKWFWILLCGLTMAFGLLVRFESLVALILAGLYLFLAATPLPRNLSGNIVQVIRDRSRWRWLVIYMIFPFLAILWLLYFNFVRFGSFIETGYNREFLFEKPWVGSFGLLFSPSTGLFIYAPLMLLIFWGLRPAWRHLPRPYFWFVVVICLFYWVFYGSWFSWGSTWVWGPRFLLHILPLLMVFVAEALAWIMNRPAGQKLANGSLIDPDSSFAHLPVRLFAWAGVVILAAIGFVINLLGIAVDLNEHFLRLGRNDNFLFNWEAFPPLGHWRILQEGLVDIIWLRPHAAGLEIEWPVLAPALALVVLVTVGLVIASQGTPRVFSFILHPSSFIIVAALAVVLIYLMMIGTARVALANEQAQADGPVLDLLATSARPGDALLIPMPPFGDVQEMSTGVMANLDRPLPTYAWIESEPRAMQPDERERVWQAVQAEAGRVWLFERWLTQSDPLGLTASRFNQEAFQVQEQWFEQSGKLTLYALADGPQPALSAVVNIPFQGGLTLVDFAVFEDTVVAPGEILKVRLSWQLQESDQLASASLPNEGIVSFVHLLDQTPSAGNVAQYDRLLLDLQNVGQSPLLPGQAVSQGYGLRLPDDLAPGSYPLITGLYVATTGQRLRRADDLPDDFLYLTDIVVR